VPHLLRHGTSVYDYVVVGGQVFQQSVGIIMGTNCASFVRDLFCIHMRRSLFKSFYMRRKNILPWLSIRHFDISTTFYLLTTINFHSYVSLIYPNDLEIKCTTVCSTSASYLDILLKLNTNVKIIFKLYFIHKVNGIGQQAEPILALSLKTAK
jgi:hypothetical protein